MTNEELVQAIRAGDASKVEELWVSVKGFIWQQARSYYLNGQQERADVELEDFVQVGYFAMIYAIERYDLQSGYKFMTYLGYALQNEFNDLGQNRTCRQKGNAALNPVSLDQPIQRQEANTITLLDTVPDSHDMSEEAESRVFVQQMHRDIETALQGLPERTAEAIKRKYMQGQTLQEIGNAMHCSPERARATIAKGIRSLRRNRTLKRYREELTSYYWHVGVDTFQRTGTSAVELLAMLSEEMQF